MCTVSYIGDQWTKYPPPTVQPYVQPWNEVFPPTRAEFDALKKEIEELKKLLLAAKAYDEATGQPDCEVEEKVGLIKKLADLVGVDMSDVFGEGENHG